VKEKRQAATLSLRVVHKFNMGQKCDDKKWSVRKTEKEKQVFDCTCYLEKNKVHKSTVTI